MKKVIVAIALLLISAIGHAQTVTAKNLQIGISNAVAGQVYPTAASNAALMDLPTGVASTITRLGFYVPGDAPPLNYTASASACSINSGAGDNGSQVQSADSKCWVATFPDLVDVREFGADPTGATDSTTAIQSAVNIGRLAYVRGNFKFTTLTMSAGGIVGDGNSYSRLTSTDTTSANVINFSANSTSPGPAAPIFRDFTLTGSLSKTAGAGLLITAPSIENDGARITDVMIVNMPTSLQFGAAALWSIQNSSFINYSIAGVSVANTSTPDSGDSVLAGSWFVTSVGAAPVGVLYQSSGGLKLVGNKFNQGAYGVLLALNPTASTSDLLINGNSIEGMSTAAIQLARASGTTRFSNIEIVGNQMAGNRYGVVTDNSGAFSNITIQGNAISLPVGTNGAGVDLIGVDTFSVSGNTIVGNGGAPTGISIDSTSTNGKIGSNIYRNLTTSISNGSASTFYARDKQVVAATVTTSTAYGSGNYAGNTTAVFPSAFSVVPEVTCSPSTGAGGGIAATATSITTTGFTVNATGVTNGGSVPVTCQAEGVI